MNRSIKNVLRIKDFEPEIQIKEPIEFFSLTIQKRLECCYERYKNVCLVIDSNIADQICTDSDTGFNGQENMEITWTYASKGIYFHTFIPSTFDLLFSYIESFEKDSFISSKIKL